MSSTQGAPHPASKPLLLVRQLVNVLGFLVRASEDHCLEALAHAADVPREKDLEPAIATLVAGETKDLLDKIRGRQGYEAQGQLTLELAQWACERDDERTGTLIEKAGTLSSQVSTTLVIVFGVGGYLLLNQQQLATLLIPMSIAYAGALILMLQSLGLANKSLHVTEEWKGLNQPDLFHLDVLTMAERPMFLAVALWKVYRANKHVNDRIARDLKRGQIKFQAAVTLLAAMGLLLAFSSWKGFSP
jgi:hypothetical protein